MTKRLWSIALLNTFVWPCLAQAEIHISPAFCIKNSPPGRCGWCAVETLARYHGLRGLYNLAQNHASTCNPDDLEEVLVEAGVRYRIQYPGKQDQDILRYAVREGLGAVIGLRQRVGVIGHIVTLVDFTETVVKIIDSNDVDKGIQEMNRDRFFARWDGFALVLEPDSSWIRLPAKGRFGDLDVDELSGPLPRLALLPSRLGSPWGCRRHEDGMLCILQAA